GPRGRCERGRVLSLRPRRRPDALGQSRIPRREPRGRAPRRASLSRRVRARAPGDRPHLLRRRRRAGLRAGRGPARGGLPDGPGPARAAAAGAAPVDGPGNGSAAAAGRGLTARRADTMPAARDRVPPGQTVTAKWPVLTYGDVPQVDTARWRFRIWGAV